MTDDRPGRITTESIEDPRMHVATLVLRDREEIFVTSPSGEDASPDLLARAAVERLRDGGATVIAQDLFVPADASTRLPHDSGGPEEAPVTRIRSRAGAGAGFGGVLTWGIRGPAVERVRIDGRVVGSRWADADAEMLRIGGVRPAEGDRGPALQAVDAFLRMEEGLRAASMEWSDVVRTWLYLADILSWYETLNESRDRFFRDKGIAPGRAPASTGMGGENDEGRALETGLLAIRPRREGVSARPVASPLQGPAVDYGSSFSRAVEGTFPDHRRLLVSGTASLDPQGRTVHVGDAAAQIDRTLDVIEAILESRGMGWGDTVRSIAYLKHPEHRSIFERCRARRLPRTWPGILVANDVCRDELLFEMEVDAVRVR